MGSKKFKEIQRNSKNFGPIDQIGSRKGHLDPNSNLDGLKEIHRYSKNFGQIDRMGSRKGHLAPNSNSDGLKKIHLPTATGW